MITFHLPQTAVERLSFAYSPLLEAVLSLHVIVEPKHHPLQHPWVRQMQRLSPELKREIAAFSFAYRTSFPEFLFPPATGTFATLESEYARLRATAPDLISLEFTKVFYDTPVAQTDAATARALIIKKATALGPDTLRLVKLALEEPYELLDGFLRLLSDYWEAAFRDEWQRIEELLAQTISQAGRQIAAHGLYAFLQGLWPEIRIDRANECFWLERPHKHTVAIGPQEQFVLVPSIYVWPHVRVNCDPPWPLSLAFPIHGVRQPARPPILPHEALRGLRALADETRLQALRFIAERPRSTQELAPLVGLSEAALSKHLRLLADAGILRAQRVGYYVLYHLAPEQVSAILENVQAYLYEHSSTLPDSFEHESDS